MKLSRRKLLALGASGVALAGCHTRFREVIESKSPLVHKLADRKVRLLNRIAFGASSELSERLDRLGEAAFIEEQLKAGLPPDPAMLARVASLDIFTLSTAELFDLRMEAVLGQLQQQAILQAVYNPNQLEERMVEFWSNHFNIFARVKDSAFRKPADELRTIRRHALGRFPDLLKASAHSPAMLAFLDNPDSRKGKPNENYARELMELHSMGVDGGYSQRDVHEVARCFTGWTIENRFMRPRGQFRFDPERHDDGKKVVLGHEIPAGGGKSDGERVLRILGSHPSTAAYITRKLCRAFLGSEDANSVAIVAAVYQKTGGDIREMLRTMFQLPGFWTGPPIVKRPFDFAVSVLRLLGAATDGGPAIQNRLADMGQPLYQWPMPDGYPDDTAAWTGSILARWNFVLAIAEDRIADTRADWSKIPDREQVLGTLLSPEFQWR